MNTSFLAKQREQFDPKEELPSGKNEKSFSNFPDDHMTVPVNSVDCGQTEAACGHCPDSGHGTGDHSL